MAGDNDFFSLEMVIGSNLPPFLELAISTTDLYIDDETNLAAVTRRQSQLILHNA